MLITLAETMCFSSIVANWLRLYSRSGCHGPDTLSLLSSAKSPRYRTKIELLGEIVQS